MVMVAIKNVEFFKPEYGEKIKDFAKELVDYRKESEHDLIGEFNWVYIEVKKQTTEEDIVRYYRYCKRY